MLETEKNQPQSLGKGFNLVKNYKEYGIRSAPKTYLSYDGEVKYTNTKDFIKQEDQNYNKNDGFFSKLLKKVFSAKKTEISANNKKGKLVEVISKNTKDASSY